MKFNELLVITTIPEDDMNRFLDQIRDFAIKNGYEVNSGTVNSLPDIKDADDGQE